MGKKQTVIAVLGAGGWGTTLSILLARKNHRVLLWEAFPGYAKTLDGKRENVRFLPGFRIPDSVRITSCLEEALKDASFLLAAPPSVHFRSLLRRVRPLYRGQPLLVATKGLETPSGRRMSQVAGEELDRPCVAVLSGPTIAREILGGSPSAAVIASADRAAAARFQRILSSDLLRLYTSSDVVGVELGGALKNIMAIGAGILDGLGMGTNTKAAYLTRGLKEMARIGVSLGAQEITFRGLSGMGDLVTTCFSPFSRNRLYGQALAEGRGSRFLRKSGMAVEGIPACAAVRLLTSRQQIPAPITRSVHGIVFGRRDPMGEVRRLMSRRLGEE